jgi:hypothetical protein
MTAQPKDYSWRKRGAGLHGLKALKKPKPAANPSMISQQSKQQKPITLAKVWSPR